MAEPFVCQKHWVTRNFTPTAISFCTTSEPDRISCAKECPPKVVERFVRPHFGDWERGRLMASRFSMTAALVHWRTLFLDTKKALKREQKSSVVCRRETGPGC